MRIPVKYALGQLSKLYIILFVFIICSCNLKKEEIPLIAPVTSPLSRDYIGFGVITSSFTHITSEPAENSPSIGYLRRGSLVRIIKRQSIKTNNNFVSWVYTDGSLETRGSIETQESTAQGWLKEEVMDIYESESQAKTASESILK
ncbi:MAG: hypothetical protein FWB86_04340 [Treponema sp.]|nr:hypothetical protein [Treponema sp.]MCL2250299.1 hypothetical protein [Treponema sp.]